MRSISVPDESFEHIQAVLRLFERDCVVIHNMRLHLYIRFLSAVQLKTFLSFTATWSRQK